MEIDAAVASPSESIRMAMVDQLCKWGLVRSAPVEAALRAVPRHVFVPDVSVERAYANEAVVTHRDAAGVAVSSASAPGVVTSMSEQLDVRPGQRVLEIGAGTGYNAALLAHIVGPAGAVTTVELDEDVAAAAERGLAAAGLDDVSVVCGDGEFGYADHGPYDRIVVTAGAWDVPPAWWDQLASDGRMVVPLRIRGLTRSIAFEREDGMLVSRSIQECGFVPVRGAGGVVERNIRIGAGDGDGGCDVVVRIDDGQPVDAEALGRVLDHPATLAWTGVQVGVEGFDQLDFWLAGLDGFCRVLVMGGAVQRGLAAPALGWGSMGLYDPVTSDTFAYLTMRPTGDLDGAGYPLSDLGVCASGAAGADLAGRFADRIQAWDRERYLNTELRVELHPAGTGEVSDARLVVEKRNIRVIVRTVAPLSGHQQQAVPTS